MSNTKASLLSTVAVRKAAIIEALSAHISFDNVVRTFENDSACVTFDVLVDGKALDIPGLEWTDEDGDLVREDRNNDVNRELIDALHEALPGTSDTIDTLDFDFDDADTYVAFFALLQRAVEATTPSDPEGDKGEWIDDWSEPIAARDAALAHEAEEDERLRLDYSNALISLDDITVSGSTTADVQRAFDELMHAALNNPFGQDIIREAKEVLEGTQWRLDDDCARIVERIPTPPEGPEGDADVERIEAEVYCDDSVLGVGEYRAVLRVQLSQEGRLTVEADERHSSENTVPSDVWHNRTLEWTASLSQGSAVVADRDALYALAEEVAALAAVVHAGHSVDWDGRNGVGELTGAADAAATSIAMLVDNADWTADVEVWDAQDWVSEGIGHLGITRSTTDDELQDIADSVYRDAEGEGHRLYGDAYSVLERHREELRADEADQDDEDETLAA